MDEFLEYLRENDILNLLFKKYHLANENDILFVRKIIQEFELLNLQKLDTGAMGRTYETLKMSDSRKELGEFYTSEVIVSYILSALGYSLNENIESKTIIDFSCGAGSFLLYAINILISRWIMKMMLKDISDISVQGAKKIIENIHSNIIGVEVSPIAAILCVLNIHLTLFNLFKVIRNKDIEYTLPEFKIHNISAFEINFNEQFDYIVGNPPYVFIRNIPIEQKKIIESKDFQTNKGQYDYYQIFIEIGIRFLRNHGRLGYIVPDSILTLTNRRIIRKYIYHLTKIRELFHTGPKFKDLNVSNTIIILEKEESQIARENNTIQINLALNNEIKKKKLLQKQIKSWNYDFLIHIDKRDIKILDYLSSHFKSLGEIMDLDNYEISLSRGVELGKDGQVICCNNCGYYIPLPKKPIACFKCKNLDFSFKSPENIIIQEIPKKEENLYKSYIFALERYRVKEKRYINITKKGINYKNLDNYKNSILIRQISKNNHICATLNQDSSLTSQSIYNLRLIRSDIVEFNELYLLGLINSSLISFFFIKSFGSYKKLFPRILIEKLKSLPIKIPILESEKKIANEIGINVKKILNNKNRNFPNLSELIDELVFKLYDIPLSFREIVKNSFS